MNMLMLVTGPLETVCYVLYDGTSALIVDPGGDGDRIVSELTGRGLIPEIILLTHGHFDHVSAVGDVRRKFPSVKAYIHKDDALMMKDGEISYASEFGIKVDPLTYADVLVEGGDGIEWNSKTFSVLHTPGHTPGSVCYVSGDVMFSGDTLFKGSVGTTSLYGGDAKAQKKTLKRLMLLKENYTVFPGHGDKTTLGDEIMNNPFMNQLIDGEV